MRRLRDDFLDEVDAIGPDGKKMRLLRPNARLEGILEQVVPGILEWGLKHVKFNAAALAGAAGVPMVNADQLGQALMGGIAQKAMSGKKLQTADLMQAALGYLMPKLQGLMQGLAPAAKKPGTENPFLKEVGK